MSDRLELAVRAVARVVPDLREIVRADVDDGGALVLTALDAEGTRWFTHDDRGLTERFPERDAKLPLAARLRESRDWRTLSYRPGRRMVVRFPSPAGVEVQKGHKRGRAARAAARQGLAEAAMRRGAFRVPHLLRVDPQHEALVFEYLTGSEVELGPDSAPLYARFGQRLAVFQDDEHARELDLFGVSDELQVLERWRGKVLQGVGPPPPGWPEAHERLTRLAVSLPEPRVGLCHRDLHDRQVHLDGAEVALLDFDLLCRADVALDPGNLCAHLRWRALQGLHRADGASARALEEAFLAGLGRGQEPGFGARLAFYRASALLRLALVYRLRPRWSPRVAELVALARSVLDDLAPLSRARGARPPR